MVTFNGMLTSGTAVSLKIKSSYRLHGKSKISNMDKERSLINIG